MNVVNVKGRKLKELSPILRDMLAKKMNLVDKVTTEKVEPKDIPQTVVEIGVPSVDIMGIPKPKTDLKKLTVKQLKELCKERSIKVSSKDKEKDLIDKLVKDGYN